MGGGLRMRSEKIVVSASDSTSLVDLKDLDIRFCIRNDPHLNFNLETILLK